MLPVQPVRATSWLPDLFDPDNPGYARVMNALPHEQGFYSIRGIVPDTPAVLSPDDGVPVGSIWGRDAGNKPYAIVGASDGVYFQNLDGSWSQQHPGVITNAADWSFVQFQNRIIAVTPGVDIHSADLDLLDHDSDDSTGYFTPLAGNPPRASRIGVFRNFVMLGNLDDHPHRVQWSGFNNSELWTPNASTQSGLQDLPGHAGEVQAIVPGERGLIFQENAIHRVTHVGQPLIVQFDEVERNRGTQAPNSVCWTGYRVFYYSPVGFFEYHMHTEESIPIGHNKVDRWVNENVADTRRMRGVVDPLNKVAAWSIVRGEADHFTHILIYRWDIGAWGLIRADHTLLSVYVSTGVQLDETSFNTFYDDNIDNPDVQISFDSPIWTPGALTLHAFGTDNTRGGFEGDPMPAVFETGYRPVVPGASRFHLNAVRPLLDRRGIQEKDIATAHVTVTAKNDLSDAVASRESSALVRSNGRADVRLSGRYASFRLATTGAFAGVSGFLVHSKPKGGRGDDVYSAT